MFNPPKKNVLSSTGIAILASLGIHGLLWAVLPGLTVSQADKSPSQRTIGLVDLSPQEQSRLPQVASPVDNTLPAFASQLTELPPAPPPPPYQVSVAPPLQLSPGSTPIYNTIPNQNSVPPLQTFQVPLPPPPSTSFPPIPSENIPSSSNYYPLPSAAQAPPFVLPPNNGLPDAPLTPDRTLPPDDAIATATPPPEQTPPTPINQNTPPATSRVTPNRLPERGKQELLAMQKSMRDNFPDSPANPAPATRPMSRQELATALRGQQNRNPQPTPATRPMSSQELAAALRGQQTRNPQPKRPMSSQEIATALRGQTRNSSNELSEETKTALDNLRRFKRQQAEVQAQNPDVVTSSPIRRKLTACDRKLDDLAIVSVVVNPEGKRLSEPFLINEPRKANLTKARDYVRNYQFTKTGKTINYNFRLEFSYSASKCSQAQPSTSKPTPTSTPELTPAPIRRTPKLTPTPTPNSETPSPEATSTPQPTPLPIDPKQPSF